MLTRSEQQAVEAAVEKNFDVKQYAWHKYTSSRGTKLIGPRGSEVVLRNGDLYGVKEYNSKQDMYLVLKMPTAVFKVAIPASDKLMNEKSVEVKGKKPTLPKNPPTKIKVDMAPPAKKKTVTKPAKKTLKEALAPKAAKPKFTANQKKIVAVKMEIKRLRGLTQNGTNLRKIEAQKAELKKLQAKEKKAGVAAPKAQVSDANKVNTETKVKTGAAPASKPFNPLDVSKKLSAKKANKIKVQVSAPVNDDDDDDDEFDHNGIVDVGGEFDFDDDIEGLVNIPLPESWSASESGDKRKSKRLILDNEEDEE